MISYIIIGICIFLLLAVIYISAKPISMGIEARRNINEVKNTDDPENEPNEPVEKQKISDEILKLNQLKEDGILTEDEYKKAKDKLLS